MMKTPFVESPTEKPRGVLTLVRFHCPILPVSFQCSLSQYSVCTAPVRNHMHQPLHARENSRTLTATPLLGHAKTPHTLVGVDSAHLVAAVDVDTQVVYSNSTGRN